MTPPGHDASSLAALREREQRYRALADAATDGIAVVIDDRIFEANESLAALLGYAQPGDLVGRTFSEICPVALNAAPGHQHLTEGPRECAARRADGSVFPVEVFSHATLFLGRPACVVGFRDLTRQKRLEEQLRQAQKLEAVAQLARGVSHDINNLLTAVFGHVGLVRAQLPAEHPAAASIDQIERAAQAAAGVGRALMAFSHPRSAERAPVDVGGLVESSARLIRPMLPETISLRVVQTDVPSPRVLGDEVQLQQVLLNLALRARDAMSLGGELTISFAPMSRSEVESSLNSHTAGVRITVSDTGPSPAALQSAAESEARPSGGLGMALIHAIVRDHGGTIQLDNEAGDGSQYTILLPAIPPGDPRTDAPTESMPRGAGELILIAEDYDLIRGLMVSTLTTCGFKVLQASDGAQLMELFSANRDRVRLLLLDLDLPRRSGLDCLRQIRETATQPPTILLTGDDRPELEDWCDQQTFLFRKPFKMSVLAQFAARVLRSPESDSEVAP